jgi:hypothetical protein
MSARKKARFHSDLIAGPRVGPIAELASVFVGKRKKMVYEVL